MTRVSYPSTPLSRAACTAALLLFLAAGCGGESGQVEGSARATPPPQQADPSAQPELIDLSALGYDEGSEETAVLGIVEFSDFGCIHCATFHAESYPALQEEFVATGAVLWKYVPITLAGFPNADLAGTSALCAGDLGMFTSMRDHLFRQREEWLASSRGEALFVEYASALGLSPEPFRTCLTGPDARARLESNNAMARRIGVGGTPTFIVAGSPVQGAPPLATFQTALRDMITEAGSSSPTN